MHQGKLFENEKSWGGERNYGKSPHFHHVFKSVDDPDAYSGARMVKSTVTEMLANVSLSTSSLIHR